MAAQHSGGCLCEAVRYEFSVEPLMTVHCYCRDCQKITFDQPRETFPPPKHLKKR